MDIQWWCSAQGIPWSWDWRPYPGVWLFVLLLAVPYVRQLLRDIEVPVARRVSGVVGVLLVWIALDWPVGALGGGYLASVHMVQYLTLSLFAPALLVFGMPAAVERAVANRKPLLAVVSFLTHPVRSTVLFVATFLSTHAAPVTDSLMLTQWGSLALDMAWLVSSVFFWWPLVGRPPGREPLPPLHRIVSLMAGSVPHTPIAMWLILSSHPVYGVFELAPRVNNFDARMDQQLAGGLMLTLGGIFVIAMLTVIFFRMAGVRSAPDAAP